MPDGKEIVTEEHSDDELHAMIATRFMQPGTSRQLDELVAAIEAGEHRRSTAFLGGLGVEQDLGNWNDGDERLAFAHHKLGKGQLGALFLRMQPEDQDRLRQQLGLERTAGPGALARLPSNLISPRSSQGLASSDHRTDDPMNNSASSMQGEEYLDLVHDTSGMLTPRSREYRKIVDRVARPAHERQATPRVGRQHTGDRLSTAEADTMIDSITRAEALHLKLEGHADRPSHDADDSWTLDDSDKFTKKPVAPLDGGLTPLDWQRWREQRDARVNARRIEKFRDHWISEKPLSFHAWKEFRGYWSDDDSLDEVMREEYQEYWVPLSSGWRRSMLQAARQQNIPEDALRGL